MSWFETDEPGDRADGDGWGREPSIRRWPLHWEGLYPRERWLWFEHLWSDACALRKRYRLPLRSGWWADQVQVETLDDPPGKLAALRPRPRRAAPEERHRAGFARTETDTRSRDI